jgi:phosphohistidine phosphatase SixA
MCMTNPFGPNPPQPNLVETTKVRFVLVRHADRHWGANDEETLLTEAGREQVRNLADSFVRLGVIPGIYLTSRFKHAQETATILAERISGIPSPRICPVCTLTPHSPGFSLEVLLDEADAMQADLSGKNVIVLVGHEPRLSQLLARVMAKRGRPIAKAEAVCVQAVSLCDFLRGKGTLEFRLPIVDYQEEQLRPKVTSKTGVSTFLAGFTFAALVELLKGGNLQCPTVFSTIEDCAGVLLGAATIALTAALALFIAAVYMYDRLSMPEGLWSSEDRPRGAVPWRGKAFEQHLQANGVLYALMIWTWNRVFSPAVVFALIGFVAILIGTGNWWLIGGGLLALGTVAAYYYWYRPRLGVD